MLQRASGITPKNELLKRYLKMCKVEELVIKELCKRN